MTKHVPIHLGYVVAQSIAHQASDAHVGVLHAGSYITRLVRGMGQLQDIECMRFVVDTIPLGIETL